MPIMTVIFQCFPQSLQSTSTPTHITCSSFCTNDHTISCHIWVIKPL